MCKKVSCGLLVRASQTGVSGLVRGDLSCGVQQGTAPDCKSPNKSTTEMYIPTSFVQFTASFAVNSRCDPCLAG
eukprot:2387082-Prymnesium_polylepis.1